jgi:hypothetical protein
MVENRGLNLQTAAFPRSLFAPSCQYHEHKVIKNREDTCHGGGGRLIKIMRWDSFSNLPGIPLRR